MELAPHTRLGRYEIVSLIGQGAMGVVYRARDASLNRDVAIKVLAGDYSKDAERLRRFDQEARAAGALNHPNVVAVLDVGTHDAAPFVVTELLEGHTLRRRLEDGALPLRKALEFGVQMARGLAAAHAKGIIHRDLKPENVFVTNDGQVKILDFGLAKLLRDETGSRGASDSLAATAVTEMGRVLGTVGYMAPEQVRGEAADHRADLFAFGCVLQEIVTGQPPFRRGTSVDSMAAILNEDMPAIPQDLAAQAPLLTSLLRRLTEKVASERFESARDVAYNLEALLANLGQLGAAGATDAAVTDEIKYERVTFRRGVIWTARFTPDGHSVIYSASWEGKPLELFWSHLGNPEARSLGILNTDLLDVSPSNELAVLLRAEFITSFDRRGTLARIPPMGGAARELLHDVHLADWSPDGQQLAIVRAKQGMIRLEFPAGNVLYQTAGWISQIRISPDGKYIAAAEHPARNTDGGWVVLFDRTGGRRVLSQEEWGSIRGLAWQPHGTEVWFTADRAGAARGLYAMTLDGKERRVLQLASNLTLHDIAADGRVLVGHGPERAGINGLAKGNARERDLSWLDWSLMWDISDDGRSIVFDETAEGGGGTGSVFLRASDGSPAIRLGDGSGGGISSDGEWVTSRASATGSGSRIVLLPTGVGEPHEVKLDGVVAHNSKFLIGNRVLLVCGHEPGHGPRLYRVDANTGQWNAISPEGIDVLEHAVVPHRNAVLAINADQEHWLYPIDGGDPVPVPVLDRSDRVIRWIEADDTLLVYRTNEMPAKMYRVNATTGERTLWRELTPPDPTGIFRMGRLRASADGETYGYSYYMQLIDLHVISGLH